MGRGGFSLPPRGRLKSPLPRLSDALRNISQKRLKFAVTDTFEFGIVIVIGLLFPVIVPVTSPDQFLKLYENNPAEAAVAVSVTVVPGA